MPTPADAETEIPWTVDGEAVAITEEEEVPEYEFMDEVVWWTCCCCCCLFGAEILDAADSER